MAFFPWSGTGKKFLLASGDGSEGNPAVMAVGISGSVNLNETDPIALALFGTNQTAYAAGTAYSLTNTAAALTFGTTQPAITFAATGTYIVNSRVRLDYNGATFAAVRTATLKLRRTNNTAADIANSSSGVKTEIVTTLSGTLIVMDLQPVIVAVTLGDTWTIFGSLDVVPTAGSLDAVEASIVAQRIA